MAEYLRWLMLGEPKVRETLKNIPLTERLTSIVRMSKDRLVGTDEDAVPKQKRTLLYQLGTRVKQQCQHFVPMMVGQIIDGTVGTEMQLAAALDFLLSHSVTQFEEAVFLKAIGAGVVIGPEQIEDQVMITVKKYEDEIIKERYNFNSGRIVGEVKTALRWVDGAAVKREVDLRMFMLLGAKTPADSEALKSKLITKKSESFKKRGKGEKIPAAPKKEIEAASSKEGFAKHSPIALVKETVKQDGLGNKEEEPVKKSADPTTKVAMALEKAQIAKRKIKVPAVKKEAAIKAVEDENADHREAMTMTDLLKNKTVFHKVGENHKTDGYVITPKTAELLKKHFQEVGGKVVTRFPPEPNGVLHIGHAKAININFGYAKSQGGICYLRFDDTNPEKEEVEFVRSIKQMVKWLGFKPIRITHSSDYFEQLYDLGLELIRRNKAYVCHQTVEEMRGWAEQSKASPWRDRPVEESLSLFKDMRHGKFEEGAATLRLKLVLEEGKMDPVAYRIKYLPHHRTSDKWCIYPTYDYTHCLCDSIENITHSLCTKEFQSRRSSYYWLCNALDVYCPVQWEYGRLNMNYTVVSKRKIAKLISAGIVKSWDDPRLFTLTALRRRGIPPEAINNFVAGLGLTGADMSVEPSMLDAAARDFLNLNAPRTMAVLDPLKVYIVNYENADFPTEVEVPDFPGEIGRGKHKVVIGSSIYIERDDYRETTDDEEYRRLTKDQTVGLKYVGVQLKIISDVKDDDGRTTALVASFLNIDPKKKPRAFVHWVSDPVCCEVRLYEQLFSVKIPGAVHELEEDVNENTLVVYEEALIDKSIASSKVYDRYQFERTGYFAVDPDSTAEKLVFNRTVSLRADSNKH